MTALNQNFTVYQGDASAPQFTVLDAAGQPVDISTATNILFSARRSLADPAVLTKTKTGGGITFVTTGADGKYQVLLLGADTLPLSGFYFYETAVVDALGNQSTVAVGQLQVGAAPIWTYSGDPSSSPKDAVRFLIGDTLSNDQQLKDPEILFAISQRSSIYGAAADCCRALASLLSRQADTVEGNLRNAYSQRSRAYALKAGEYETKAVVRSAGAPYAGAMTISDKMLQEMNADRVQPQFNLGMTDNLLPVAPAGNETPNLPANPAVP